MTTLFHLDILYEVVLSDGTTAQAFRCKGRSDHPDGTWLRHDAQKYGHVAPVEVSEVIGIVGREKEQLA